MDFSSLTDSEIINYIEKRKGEKMCGRFKKEQISRPLIHISPDVLHMNIPLWKKFLAAVFICFSSFLISCEGNPTRYEDIPLPVLDVKANIPSVVPAVKKKSYMHISEKDSIDISCIVLGTFTVTSETQTKAPIIITH